MLEAKFKENDEYYFDLGEIAQYVGIKKDTLRKRIDRNFYNTRRVPINQGEEPTKPYHKKTCCSYGLMMSIITYEGFEKMKQHGQDIEVDEYGYLNADDFSENFNSLKKRLVNNLKSDDRYTKTTDGIITDISNLFGRLITAYKKFEPHDKLGKNTLAGIIGDTRVIAKKIEKKQEK